MTRLALETGHFVAIGCCRRYWDGEAPADSTPSEDAAFSRFSRARGSAGASPSQHSTREFRTTCEMAHHLPVSEPWKPRLKLKGSTDVEKRSKTNGQCPLGVCGHSPRFAFAFRHPGVPLRRLPRILVGEETIIRFGGSLSLCAPAILVLCHASAGAWYPLGVASWKSKEPGGRHGEALSGDVDGSGTG